MDGWEAFRGSHPEDTGSWLGPLPVPDPAERHTAGSALGPPQSTLGGGGWHKASVSHGEGGFSPPPSPEEC